MSAAFTPGPWEPSNNRVHVAGKGNLCTVENPWNNIAEREANARLIAAAPKMIDVLQRVADCEDGVISEAVHELVLEVIDEALGRANPEGLMDMGGFAI